MSPLPLPEFNPCSFPLPDVLCNPNGVFNGVRFMMTKVVGPALQLNHTISLNEKPSYAFNPTFILAKDKSPVRVLPVPSMAILALTPSI